MSKHGLLPDLTDFCRMHAVAWFDTEHISTALVEQGVCSCPRCGARGAGMRQDNYRAVCQHCGYGKGDK